jgi:asparagine synthase (glutamine-hydrolysing)
MCGICGIVHVDGAPAVDGRVVAAMARAMTHRGPDQEGLHVEPRVGLGSRRLSIIDVAGGRQPIANEDESMFIVFNGEIYNYRELRLFLEHKGHRFRTHSDTEVILHLFEEYGDDVVEYLNGIFAFAIWDRRRNELFAARDRMGVKPFYYARTRQGLTFGSELRVVLANGEVDRQLDLAALNEYLSFEFVPTPRTMLKGVERLPAAHTLRSDGRTVTVRPYWTPSLARSESQPPVQWREFAARLEETLSDAVREELVSDVPVGVLLSGGIDSSAIASFMVGAHPGTVDSFSVAFDEPSFDESRYAQTVSKHLGTRHHELRLTSRMAADVVPRIADVMDEPLGDASFIPTYLLSKFASEHVKVVLGGDGSDELFGGYPTLVAHRLIEYYERTVPRVFRTYAIPKLLPLLPVSFDYFSRDFKIRRFLSGRGVPLEARHHRWMGSYFDEDKARLFQDWVRPVLGETYASAYRYARECDARLTLNRVLYDDMKLYLEGDILTKVDRASMAASLEVRVPFLNRRVVEFATSLPLSLKLRRLTGKYLLKRSMAGRLPREIIERKKQGFAIPVAHWLTSELKDLAGDMLSPDRIRRQGLFEPAYVTALLDDHLARRRDNRKLIWTLLIFQLWQAKYLEGGSGSHGE